MSTYFEAVLAPAEYRDLRQSDLSKTVCVVFDILRATTTMLTALANGAAAIVPVSEIEEALAARAEHPDWLLAGERHGYRIGGDLTGGIEFDFGNSPREMIPQKVHGRSIAMTTTNGTRALKACQGACAVLAASFLNISATARWLQTRSPEKVLLVCAGTGEQAALEDTLAAGALFRAFQELAGTTCQVTRSDSVLLASLGYDHYKDDLIEAMPHARNGRRLLSLPELKDDVPICLQRDTLDFCGLYQDGRISRVG